MRIETAGALEAVAIGVGATLTMDTWNLFLRRAFGIASLNYCMLGRWVRHFSEGTFHHASIAAAARRPLECPVGWMAHYSIGIVLAFGFLSLTANDWLARPTLLPAIAYGVATVIAPYFVLQPALGLGLASSKAPQPARARLKSLATHVVFGVGLYLAALFSNQLMSMLP